MSKVFLVHGAQGNPAERRGALERAGFHVLNLRSGGELLAALEEGRPSLVVMDVLLSGPTGFDVCRQLRQRFRADELPVVLCSQVYKRPEHAAEALAVGAQRYLKLPCDAEGFLREVTGVLSEHAGRSAAA